MHILRMEEFKEEMPDLLQLYNISNLLIHKKFIYILSTLCYNTIVYVTNGAIAPF